MRLALCAILCAALHAAPARAQPVLPFPMASPADVLFAEGNLLGLLEYCHAQGFVSAAAIDKQREAIQHVRGAERLSGPQEVAGREAGAQGIVAFWESRVPIATAAQAQGITVASRCKYTELSLAIR